MTDQIPPHQHRWAMLSDPPVVDKYGLYSTTNIRVMPNFSCDICGLTPEAVANTATIKTLLAEIERLSAILAMLPIATAQETHEKGGN